MKAIYLQIQCLLLFVCISKIELESVHFSYVNDFALDVNMHGERWKLITIKVFRK